MTAVRKHVTGARAEDIRGMVRRLYDANGQSSADAIPAIIGEMRRRPAMAEAAYKFTAEALVNQLIAKDRSITLSGGDTGYVPRSQPVADAPAPYERSEAAVAASARRLRMVSVKLTGLYLAKFKYNGEEFLLGNATPEQLAPVAAHYIGQGTTMVREGRFLERIIATAKTGKPIHKSVTLQELEKMRKDALSSEV